MVSFDDLLSEKLQQTNRLISRSLDTSPSNQISKAQNPPDLPCFQEMTHILTYIFLVFSDSTCLNPFSKSKRDPRSPISGGLWHKINHQ